MSQKSQFVVVANRLPVRRGEDGLTVSPGGLVSALMPILKERGGAWVGWGGGEPIGEEPFEHDRVLNVPVEIRDDEFDGYYGGIANSALWPLYHDLVRPPRYRRYWWPSYEQVNRRFAETAAECAAEGGIVWVHDYHLHLVPAMLRALRPDLRIGFFLHIPFPGRGLFAQLPWRQQLLFGTIGADVVGFQTKPGAENFAELACKYTSATPIEGGVRIGGRDVLVDAFPISIDFERFDALARTPEVRRRAAHFRQRVGDRRLLLGVDRLDYTKGIDIRLRAFGELLRSKRISVRDAVMIQSAVPTRESVADYAELRSMVEELVGHINGDYGEVGLFAIQYLRQNLPPEELVALYLAADVMLVTPYRDGMNLVAKEYVASRVEGGGALVLSEFTGAAHELEEAILVNPHDLDGLVLGIDRAIHMPEEEAARRMESLREHVRSNTVYDWAGSFLDALEARSTPVESATT